MELAEVAKLYKYIKVRFPFFDASIEKVKADHEHLEKIPYEVALENIKQYEQTDTATPSMPHIIGRYFEHMRAQKSKDAALDHFAKLDAWISDSTPPPEGYWENVKRKLRGEDHS